MSDVFESIRWSSVLLTVATMSIIGLVYRFFLAPMEQGLGAEDNRSQVLKVHLQSTRVLEGLASDLLIAFANSAASKDEMSAIIDRIQNHVALVPVDPEVLHALEPYMLTALRVMAAQSHAPTLTQMASLEREYGTLCSTILRVTEKLATRKD